MITFLIVLSVLVIVHELGHFLVAKRLGIKVERFALGLGPKLFGVKGKQTEYVVCAIPIGGYVKMAGDSRENASGKPGEYLSQNKRNRAKVLVAGALSNYVLAFFCFWFIFIIGFPVLTSKVGSVMSEMPAKQAGIQAGDKIVAIDEKEVKYWEDVSLLIQTKKEGQQAKIKLIRNGEEQTIEVMPQFRKTKNLLGDEIFIGLIGIIPSEETVKIKYGPLKAFYQGGARLFQMTQLTLQAVARVVSGALSFKESFTGPLGIFFATSNAAKFGLAAVLHIIAILGVSLAIFNLLPIPLLDGGHLLFLAIEGIRKKPLSAKTEDFLNRISLTFLLFLVMLVFYNDILRYKVIEKIGEFFSSL